MVELTIDGTLVQVPEGTTILKAAQQAGVKIPTLCYFEDLCDAGACRICVVEVEGSDRLEAACNTPVRPGMVVTTSNDRVRESRKMNLELLRSQHNTDCLNCSRMGTCVLQRLFREYELPKDETLFDVELPSKKRQEWDPTIPIQRDASKCIQCGRCIAACNKIQNLGVWENVESGSRSRIGVRDGMEMAVAGCVACGQCITHCPTGALRERDDVDKMMAAFADPNITTVIQVAPATRTAWATAFGTEPGELGVERMCAALKQLGADYVFDTTFTADLTIMEEGTELLNIIKNGELEKLPLFTSCCPGWVNHAVNKWPKYAAHLSTAKSPMQMFGSLTKSWFAKRNDLDPAKICSVAMMPCSAKKNETRIPGTQANEGIYDMDLALTTRELIEMMKRAEIDPTQLEDRTLDDPLGTCTGAGVIFGITGGVMEAALRSAYFFMTGEKPDPDGFIFHPAGEDRPWVEATFDLAGVPVHCAVVHGLARADKLIEAVDKGEVSYEFIEVMACPGGCAGGGGQPIDGSDCERYVERGQVLRDLDKNKFELRFSHENPVLDVVYSEMHEAPCSEVAEHYLHVHERQQPYTQLR